MKTIISNKIKAQVLFSAGFKTAKSLKRRGNIPLRSAQRYISQLRRGENIVQEVSKQRKSCTRSPNIVRKVINKIKMKKGVTLKEISHSVGISQSTTRKILHETGYKYRKYSKRIKITEDARIKRLKFAQKMKNKIRQWQSICFSDECSFWLHKSQQSYSWQKGGEQIQGGTNSREKLHCWGGITSRGALKIEIFTENLKSSRYCQILKKKVKELDQFYPNGFTFQQDGSSVHKSQQTSNLFKKLGIQTLDFPSYSPDLSPIENIWGWMKKQIAKDQPKTKDQLRKCIKKYWGKITPEFLKPYFDSMQNRMEEVIQKNGYLINY